MSAHCNAVLTHAQTGGGKAAPAPPLVRSRCRKAEKRKMSGDLGLLADNEGAAQLLKPLAPVEKPAMY